MYHYSEDNNQFGPLTIEELKEKKISKETMIWHEGLDNWVKAFDVEELKHFFKSVPPPLNTATQNPPPLNQAKKTKTEKLSTRDKIKKNTGAIIALSAGLGIIITVIILFSNKNEPPSDSNNYDSSNSDYNNTTSTDYNDINNTDSYNATSSPEPTRSAQNNYAPPPRQKTEEELREELYEREKKKPTDHLSVSYDLSYKILTGEDKITGTIYNSASMATFKDVVLTISYSTATGTELGSENYVVYDYVYPGSSKSFTIKTYSPKSSKQIGVKIKSAKSE